MLNVYEVRDEYPVNPDRGAQFNEKGEPYSITSLINYFDKKLKANNEEARSLQEKLKKANSEEKKKIEEELNELSKYINLYTKRIEQLQTKPLRVGSRVEATTAGNWE
ncbi:MAG: hypothetical protein HC913_18950 [Microscillaceae bacterium]|nr:hypothetical protein [Microscillaceae bacterium]